MMGPWKNLSMLKGKALGIVVTLLVVGSPSINAKESSSLGRFLQSSCTGVLVTNSIVLANAFCEEENSSSGSSFYPNIDQSFLSLRKASTQTASVVNRRFADAAFREPNALMFHKLEDDFTSAPKLDLQKLEALDEFNLEDKDLVLKGYSYLSMNRQTYPLSSVKRQGKMLSYVYRKKQAPLNFGLIGFDTDTGFRVIGFHLSDRFISRDAPAFGLLWTPEVKEQTLSILSQFIEHKKEGSFFTE